jgi:hypothetical protein
VDLGTEGKLEPGYDKPREAFGLRAKHVELKFPCSL